MYFQDIMLFTGNYIHVYTGIYRYLYMYIYTADHVEKLINTCPLEVLAELIPNDLIQILKSMEEMFNSPDPIAVYERYRQFYVKYGGENVMNIAKEVATEFFDYTVFDSVDMKKLKKEQKIKNSELCWINFIYRVLSNL